MPGPVTIVWFRNDLRLTDHAPLTAAARRGAVLPLYVLDSADQIGAASKWWLHQSLSRLQQSLNGRLVLRRGDPRRILPVLMEQGGADAVYWQRRYEPAIAQRDAEIESELGDAAQTFGGGLLREPWEVSTKQGGPYQVFTPFWRTHRQLPTTGKPLDAPKLDLVKGVDTGNLDDLNLMPKVNWYAGLDETWTPGEAGAVRQLKRFVDDKLRHYANERDLPGVDGTSRLSPHLRFGEVSPRQVWHALARRKFAEPFLRQLGWREFSYHVLHHFPHTPDSALKEKYDNFPWRQDNKSLKAWQRGQTGYPIVDAGMWQLWRTGWMHNRVRMIVASFLVKDLLIDWRAGAAWFMDTLVDADLANNTMGWQWAGGCGADAAPYFRIFNPLTQGKKFDPDGAYIRRWVTELADTPFKKIHEPYGDPIVDHAEARDRALAAFDRIK